MIENVHGFTMLGSTSAMLTLTFIYHVTLFTNKEDTFLGEQIHAKHTAEDQPVVIVGVE